MIQEKRESWRGEGLRTFADAITGGTAKKPAGSSCKNREG
jgi:hypothetical protein